MENEELLEKAQEVLGSFFEELNGIRQGIEELNYNLRFLANCTTASNFMETKQNEDGTPRTELDAEKLKAVLLFLDGLTQGIEQGGENNDPPINNE